MQLSGDELNRIVGGGTYEKPQIMVGHDVLINKRFDHATSILNEAASNKKLPNALRAFADTLETLHPAIDAITDEVIDASFEVTT